MFWGLWNFPQLFNQHGGQSITTEFSFLSEMFLKKCLFAPPWQGGQMIKCESEASWQADMSLMCVGGLFSDNLSIWGSISRWSGDSGREASLHQIERRCEDHCEGRGAASHWGLYMAGVFSSCNCTDSIAQRSFCDTTQSIWSGYNGAFAVRWWL